MKKIDKQTLDKVLTGLSDNNIRFSDLRKLILRFEFYERIKGDHHIFTKAGVAEILNLQPLPGTLLLMKKLRPMSQTRSLKTIE